ncbi:colanic acid biosynthesis glycosyl transferase WcaI [Pseudarthrobacter siccitolerans]|uniref:Colanic acid biosynthesis glycosyl transferase WcaI n=1 Tax=Pseudarthrobacter siccitolerans TaxID=861266 RepID=A0ABU0PJ10_9MICC|nr:glycosyltransferase family 4 protein [Pseudarthrobacter siccitolerans]MDQ0673951.1 colanic acid biosynthesis glycosyl transferase WcaI [Pseudarthrobacter siccitolerans]
MKIGILTQWFHPEPALIPTSLAQYFGAEGHDVKVLTGFPNYPAGKVYPGYRQRWRQLDDGPGFRTLRVPQYVSHDTSGLRRMVSFVTFASMSLLHARWFRDRQIIYVYATPMSVCATVLYLRWVHRIPYVLHIQDLWPESVLDSGMVKPAFLRKPVNVVLHALLKVVYGNAAHIVAIAPSMASTLQQRGVPPRAVSVLYNWGAERSAPDPAEVAEFRNRVSSPDRWLIAYAGNVGKMQDVETIVTAAASLGVESGMDFIIVGDGASLDEVQALANSLSVDNVTFLGRVPFADMAAVYAAADFQLVTLLDRPVFRGTIPSKVGESLAAGVPIITTVLGDVAAMCVEGGFGWVSAPENPQALAAACRQAVAAGRHEKQTMAAAARNYYDSRLSMKAGLEAMHQILERAARNDVPDR